MNRERFEMEDSLGTAHEGPLVFCCLMDHLFHSFLSQKSNFYELSHQFPEDGLAVDAVDEKIIKLIPDFLDLGRTLLLDDQIRYIFYLFFVRSHHSFSILGKFGGLELDDSQSEISVAVVGDRLSQFR